ncbi:hypothetical protein IV203_000152 [Nitzschia inconspicua]|uniref:Uncharacterized protein n=1 Tax=Nitzschia inconspicua TaxID=303405 RepID=A0A9K3PQF1_9STRA|nr:hypothetical protein IV203_000152 [Nitzschia inconspicua]
MGKSSAWPAATVIVVSFLLLFPTTVGAIGAFQSGPNVGALYAGGLSYDSTTNELLATGITYDDNGSQPTAECSCFLAKFDAASLQGDALRASRIGRGDVVEACSAIAFLEESNFVVVGNSDPGGMFGKADVATGFAMALTAAEFQVKTGIVLESDHVAYPISVLGQDRTIYVATVTSTSLEQNPSADSVRQQYDQPNWLKYRQYGTSYEMNLQAIDFQTELNVMTSMWDTNFPIVPDASGNKEDVFLGGMILKNIEGGQSVLIAAGSTRGHGDGYGEADGNDEDGFITVVDIQTGQLSESVATNNERIGTAEDDLIAGICDDPNDPNSFYIVGGTKGVLTSSTASPPAGSLHAYVQKIDLSTLTAVWTVQLAATKPDGSRTVAVAMDCLVTNDGLVYVSGGVNDGASIVAESTGVAHGADDIFVLQIGAESGVVQWSQQIGTDGQEQLARGGSMTLDPNDDLIVFGDTTGNFYRAREGDETSSDIFLVTLYKNDGSYPATGSALIPDTPETTPAPSPSDGEDDSTSSIGQGTMDASLGIQSGPNDGSLFAGGMVYDAGQDFVYLTGITYDSDFFGEDPENASSSNPKCLVVSVSLDNGEVWDWEEALAHGDDNALNVCSSIAVHRSTELIVVGHGDSDAAAPITGIVRALDRGNLQQISSVTLVTSSPESRLEYPVSVVSDGDDVYIVALTSTDTDFSAEYNAMGSSEQSNWINIQKFGSSFDMTVTKVRLSSESMIDGLPAGETQFSKVWSQEFPIGVDPSTGQKPRVWIGGAILKKDPGFLAIVGSTRGMGLGYGDAVGDDEDGFIMLLDLETGELATNVARNNKREGSEKDDIVNGLCHDPNDPNYFYIVGETFGSMGDDLSDLSFASGSLYAFVRKVDANDLSVVWTKQFGAVKSNPDSPGEVYALSCAVSGDVLYVGGVVDNNAGIVVDGETRQSAGGDDIWVGQFSVSDGTLIWLHQVGSSGNDHMARRNGIIATASGNAILYGDTNGPSFRDREVSSVSDLIVMTFHQDGEEYYDIIRERVPTPQPIEVETFAPVAAPEPGSPPQPTAVEIIDVPLGPDVGNFPPPTSSATTTEMIDKVGMSPVSIAFLIIGILIILGLVGWWFLARGRCSGIGGANKRSRSRRRRRRRRRKVIDEDDEDDSENDFATLEMLDKRQQKDNSRSSGGDGIFSSIAYGSGGYSDDPLSSANSNLYNISELKANKTRQVI